MMANKTKSNLMKSRRDNDNARRKNSFCDVSFIRKIRILLAVSIVATASYNIWNLFQAVHPISIVSIMDHDNPKFNLPINAKLHNTFSTPQQQQAATTATTTIFNRTTTNITNNNDQAVVVDDVNNNNNNNVTIMYDAAIKRLCHCMIIGTQKGGTRALSSFLRFSHPNVTMYMGRLVPELHFFDQEWDDLNFTATTTSSFSPTKEQVAKQQEQFLQHSFTRVNKKRNFVRNPNVIGMHASPEYLFLSDRVPSRVLSTCPHTKLVALLREPVSRAISQYNHMYKYWNKTQRASYPYRNPDEYIQHDINQLKEAGVVQNWTIVDFDTFSGSTAELEAWTRYLDMVGGNGPVGRGLYAIQIRHWFSEFDRHGMKPHSDMLILDSFETITNTSKQYAKVLDFLNLPDHTILQEDAIKHQTFNNFKATENTRAMLKTFFKPYNDQLYSLVDGWDAKTW